MKERTTFTLNLVFAEIVILCLLFSWIGALLVQRGFQSRWLLLWPLIFTTTRFLAFYIFPLLLLLLIILAFRSRTNTPKVLVGLAASVVMVSLLLLTVRRVEAAFVAKAIALSSKNELMEKPMVGRTLPNRPLVRLDGSRISLSESVPQSNVWVLVFWASYNTSWSDNWKLARRVHSRWKDKGVTVIGINEGESLQEVRSFVAGHGVDFPVFMDQDGTYFKSLQLLGAVEQALVVDRQGRIRADFPKGIESERNFEQVLSEILNEE